jgi:hypothetical protein
LKVEIDKFEFAFFAWTTSSRIIGLDVAWVAKSGRASVLGRELKSEKIIACKATC